MLLPCACTVCLLWLCSFVRVLILWCLWLVLFVIFFVWCGCAVCVLLNLVCIVILMCFFAVSVFVRFTVL